MISSTLLENGIRVITEQMKGSRSVAVGVMIMVGPRDEHQDKAGISHLLEHALFHGTSSRSSVDIARMIDTIGGRVAAFTGRDYTCFSSVVMDAHRTYVFDLLSDLLLNSIFPEQKLEYEKKIITSECNMGQDHPSSYSDANLKAAMWQDHPLGRAIEGNKTSLNTISREDIIYYFHNHYLPNRIIIAVAGNLQHEDIVAQVRDCFWRLTGSSSVTESGEPAFNNRFVTDRLETNQSYFSIGIQAPQYDHENRYDVHLFNTILGGGLSSRLYRTLREDQGLVYDIHSEYQAYKDAGAIIVSGSSQPEIVFDVVDNVISIVEALALGTNPANEEELWQAKLYNIGQHHIDSEDPYTRMSRMLTQHFYFGRTLPAEEVTDGLEKVTPQSLSEMCEEVFSSFSNKVAASVVGPCSP